MNRRIALFGGSFNPPHMGHLFICNYLLHVEDFDELWIIPTYHHAFEKELVDFEHRVNMCKIMAHIADSNFGSPPDYHGKIRVLEIEKELAYDGKENRTVDTVNRLKDMYHDDFTVIIGSDCVKQLPNWKGFEEACQEDIIWRPWVETLFDQSKFPFKVLVMDRDGGHFGVPFDLPKSSIEIPNVSSSWIRRYLFGELRGRAIREMPKRVADYVLEHNLYTTEIP